MAIGDHVAIIVSELKDVLSKIDSDQVDQFVCAIQKSKVIVTHGAGRMGLVMRCFSMRLTHLEFSAYSLTDSNVPAIGDSDLLIIASGSGETQTVYDIAVLGKKHRARLALITLHGDSRIGRLADVVVELKLPMKNGTYQRSALPMKTLIEQSLLIVSDAIVMELIQKTQCTELDMSKRHSNLE